MPSISGLNADSGASYSTIMCQVRTSIGGLTVQPACGFGFEDTDCKRILPAAHYERGTDLDMQQRVETQCTQRCTLSLSLARQNLITAVSTLVELSSALHNPPPWVVLFDTRLIAACK